MAGGPQSSSTKSCSHADRGLTFIQGHRHTIEWAIQATLFRLSSSHWLVRESDLLLHSNNARANRSALELYLTLYPHTRKAIVISDANSGKRCGHLEAIAEQVAHWRCYAWLIFCHPDVYLLPGALTTVGTALSTSSGLTHRVDAPTCALFSPS